MDSQTSSNKTIIFSNLIRGLIPLTYLFLIIEFFDELNYGVGNAALPAIRTDIGFDYVKVGILLAVPGLINTFVEPILMLLGDSKYRKHIMLGGGLAIAVSLLVIGSAHSFPLLLFGMVIAYPASGAFVSLSQATLMDLNPRREPQMMARWTVAGSIANLVGPLLLAGGFALGWGWRWAFYGMAGLCLLLVGLTWTKKIPAHEENTAALSAAFPVKDLLSGLWQSARNPKLMRWMFLLPISDLLLDVLTGYLPLYFTDVARLSVTQASLVMSVLMGASLLSNILLIPILEKFPGRKVVRLSAAISGILYEAWLLAPWLWAKIGLIVLIKLVTLGWYEVLQGEAFAAVPGRSGTVMTINSFTGLLAEGIAFMIGWVAAQAGLPAAMWILLLGPVSLVLFVPRTVPQKAT